jgi:hypothetical protein
VKRGGGVYVRVKAHDRVKEGGAFVAVAPWRGRGVAWHPWNGGVRGRSSAAGALREEGEGGENSHWWAGSACLAARGRGGGLARPAWPLGARWAGSACLVAQPKRSGGLAGPEAKQAAGSAGPKIRKKEISELKMDF